MPTITHLFVSSTFSPCVHHVVRAQESTALVGRAWTPETAQLRTVQLININIDPHQSLPSQTLINKQHIMNMLSHTVGRHLLSAASQCPACNCPRSPRGKGWLSWTLPSWQQPGSPPPSKTAYSGQLSERGGTRDSAQDRLHSQTIYVIGTQRQLVSTQFLPQMYSLALSGE